MTPAAGITRMTHDEWTAEGKRRFGEDYMLWRFRCPVCGHTAAVQDFEQYKDRGATPDSATSECIGRYTGNVRAAINLFDADRAKQDATRPEQPCNYAGYGLIRISPVIVNLDHGHERHCFAFAEN